MVEDGCPHTGQTTNRLFHESHHIHVIKIIEVKQTDDLAAAWQVDYGDDTFIEEVEDKGTH